MDINLDIDKYSTVEDIERTEIKVKGSKFIATVAPVKSREEAMLFLDQMRTEFFDATHNCFAFRIGWDGNEFRAADDGEPAGSAGKPILSMLDKFDYRDAIIVVTRYFGGTKLGVGGLVRAYGGSAEETLKITKRRTLNRTRSVEIKCAYEDISFIKRMIDDVAIKFEENYAEAVDFCIHIPNSKVDSFVSNIYSRSNGKITASVRGEDNPYLL